MNTNGPKVPNYISLKVCEELYILIAEEADRNDEAMIDVVVRTLAEKFGRPDLGKVPRKTRTGRPRVKHPA